MSISSLITFGLGPPGSIPTYLLVDLHPSGPAAPVFDWSLEAELDGVGMGWTDLGDDVVMDSLICSYGISDTEPTSRTGDTGSMTFTLDNSSRNVVERLGAYSLGHVNVRAGFGFDIAIRLKLTFGAYVRYKFLGRMSNVRSVPGLYGPLVTKCEAVDWMDDAARIDIPDLDVQEGLAADELLDLVLDAISVPPAARDFDAGSEPYAFALDGGSLGSKIKVREFLDMVARSEGGRITLIGDALQGGTLQFRSRAVSTDTVAFTFTDQDHILNDGLENGDSRDDIISEIQTTAHPTRLDAGGSTVLFALQTTQTVVRVGETNDSLFGPYRDPSASQGAFIGGRNFQALTAHTDYEMNTAADGSGTDVTSDFTVTASTTGRGVRWSITNGGSVDAYIIKLQLRGDGIYRSDVIDRVQIGSTGRILQVDMPLQNSLNVAHSIGTQLAYTLSNLRSRAPRMKFLASESDDLLLQAILREPGDRIRIQEQVTGINTVYMINRVTIEIAIGGLVWCTYDLAPGVLDQSFWLLGRAGFSELGQTTRLA